MMAEASVPLCVDLDGTLTSTDLLVESFLVLVKRNPLYAFLCIGWLLRGKAHLKAQIAQRAAIDVTLLPYNARLVAFLREERSCGRDLYLCTAANRKFAEEIATYFGFFKGILASTDAHNLSGVHKASALSEEFGPHGFDYCGRNGQSQGALLRGSAIANRPYCQGNACLPVGQESPDFRAAARIAPIYRGGHAASRSHCIFFFLLLRFVCISAQ
jgi:hypothetical protein